MIPYDPNSEQGKAEFKAFLADLFNPAGDPNFTPSVQHPGYAAHRQRLAELHRLRDEPKPK